MGSLDMADKQIRHKSEDLRQQVQVYRQINLKTYARVRRILIGF